MARLITFGLGAAASDVLTLGLAAGTALAEVLRLTSAICTARGFESALAMQQSLPSSPICTARGFESTLAMQRSLASPLCTARTLASAIDLEEA